MARIKLIVDQQVKAILNPDDIVHVVPVTNGGKGYIEIYRTNDQTSLRIMGSREEVEEMMDILNEKLKSSRS